MGEESKSGPNESGASSIYEPLLVPARMLNEFVYCPRLAYLEWVQGEWADSADTVEGRYVHRRIEAGGGTIPQPGQDQDGRRVHARSITLSSERLGVIAKIDLLESDGGQVIPVDYKHGKRPHVPLGAHDPERVQLCAQALLLEEHGHSCKEGVLYFSGSRERVRVVFDEALRAQTLEAIRGLRALSQSRQIPPPLEDSPKCPRCSLVGICLPDEINFLLRRDEKVRPLAVAADTALPLYVQANNARVKKVGEVLEVHQDDELLAKVRLLDVSQVVVFGNASLSTPALQELMKRGIPVSWHSYGGWFIGHTVGTGHNNVELRTAQYRASFDPAVCLRLAKGFVVAKIRNQRTLLRRNWKRNEDPDSLLGQFESDLRSTQAAENLEQLLGAEGQAAARYFRHFSAMLRASEQLPSCRFDFAKRNRRPPTDPVNALLSYGYALLVRTWAVVLSAVGFDPYRGFFHQPRYGRPALALDMMEPFRPLLVDSSVLQVINNGEIKPTDFVYSGTSVALTNEGRKQFIAAFERRLSQEVTHPLFGYRVSYRRLLELQARLLARYLLGEIDEYPNFTTR